MSLNIQDPSPNTRRAYNTQYRQFVEWSTANAREPDTEAVCDYLIEHAELGAVESTLKLIHSAIRSHSQERELPDPARNGKVKAALKRARRMQGNQSPRQAAGLTKRDMQKIAPIATLKQLALLSLMRDCLLRRSEASAARWRDLSREADRTGRLTIPRSKTDQEDKEAVLFVTERTMERLWEIRPDFPVPGERIFDWSPGWIGRTIAKLAEAAGLKEDYSGHSPRIGMAQDLARLGASLPEIQNTGRWKSPTMPALYIRNIKAGESAVAKYSKWL